MAAVYYEVFFVITLCLTLAYAFVWHKHFDVHFTLMFCFIPIAMLGYVMLAHAENLETALAANKIIYIGGCYEILFVTLSLFSLCKIRLPRALSLLLLFFTTAVYLSALTAGRSGLFYRDVRYTVVEGDVVLEKSYGPLHALLYIMIGVYFVMCFGALIYSYNRKNDVSNRIIYPLLIPELIAVFSYCFRSFVPLRVELMPIAYTIAQIVYLIIIHRICLYDINDTVIDSLVQTGDTGFISFDFKLHYLGSNETAKRFLPMLRGLNVDQSVEENAQMRETALRWLHDFREDEQKSLIKYESGKNVYLIRINYLYGGLRRHGYQFVITDDTKNQEYIALIGRFNAELQAQVDEKTQHLIEMHDRLIMSMASMVESRDNSTGGHIKRTSEVVRILIGEIRQDNTLGLSDSFCSKVIKAAPMHDLGKIAVDDAILRKPGRFTPEEFEKMKAHAAEGARIVHEILEGTDDDEFHIIAENVAHFHHERWDGSGYPCGLKGEQIPLEARIMAVADVYDALVSKRIYKESMSFADANAIITAGWGKHFDRALEPYYLRALPKLEAYYSSLAESSQPGKGRKGVGRNA